MPEMQVSFLNMSAEGEGSPKKFKKYRAFIGIGVIAAAVGLSSTLAANININAGPVEFGQGVAQTVACSGNESIIVTPATSFTNAPASVSREVTTHGGDTVTVTSTEDISVGMLVSFGEMFAAVTEINNDIITISRGNLPDLWVGDAIFTPSSGIEQSTSSADTIYNDSEFNVGTSSLEADTFGVEIGMLVSGPGIPANTVVVYESSGEGQYIEFSKDIYYSSGELSFTNSGKSSFKLSDITVSGIPDTCNGKVFTIKLYDNESPEPLRISDFGNEDGDSSVQVWWASIYQSGAGNTTDPDEAVVQFPADYRVWPSYANVDSDGNRVIETADSPDSTMASGAFKIYLPVAVDASRVYKITIESQDDSDSFDVSDDGGGFYDWWNNDY
jgi:hypothetical protein